MQRKRIVSILLPLLALVAPATAGQLSFRIVFGENQELPADYSGSISVTPGKIVRIAPWRFFEDDAIQGADSWKLQLKRAVFENQPDKPRPFNAGGSIKNIVPAGVTVRVDAPESATARVTTRSGDFDFPLRELRRDHVLRFLRGDVVVCRTPAPQRVSPPVSETPDDEHDFPSMTLARDGTVWVAWQAYHRANDLEGKREKGDQVWARHTTASGWSRPFRLTEGETDVFQTAVAEDSAGKVWVVWSERDGQSWDLYARHWDGSNWSGREKLTSGGTPNTFHRLVADRKGDLNLVWISHPDGRARVMWSKLSEGRWSKPADISGPSAWMPAVAVDSANNLYVAWDSYGAGNYDILLRKVGADGALGEVRQVTRSPRFQAHASLAVDKSDRVWVAWDESGVNWGKDWGRDDTWRGSVLYADREIGLAVLEGGVWKQPAADFRAVVPPRYRRYAENPRLGCDASGRIWMAFQIRTSTRVNRQDYWSAGGYWEEFLTSFEGDHWTPAMPIPDSSSRPDGAFRVAGGPDGVRLTWASDNRRFPNASLRKGVRHQINTAAMNAELPVRDPVLVKFEEPAVRASLVHRDEPGDVRRIRGYRAMVEGTTYRILRGDFHRHTEISSDGSGDGSVEDYFRYMMDAASMDTGIIGDHNAGNDDEYTWWRTEKANDLFFVPGAYTPLFGYERSVPYPNGHRNVVFASRGTRTLPVSQDERRGRVNTGPVLYPYLKQHRGICMLHSLATSQGTDYRDNDPEVEPLVELHQGYHASYEYAGAPRAETADYVASSHGALRPAGFYWAALAKGWKLGVEASSDHIATHNSYTMIYTPSADRAAIVESMRRRHAYGATDNIVVDFRAVEADRTEHLMGEAFASRVAPKLAVKVLGTSSIATVEIIKDGKFVFRTEPGAKTAEFTFADQEPGVGKATITCA